MNTQTALTVELRLLAYAVFNLHRHVVALHPDRHQDLRPGQDGQLSGGRLRSFGEAHYQGLVAQFV